MMLKVIFPSLEESIRKRGEAEAKEVNEKAARGKRRMDFKLGDRVMKLVDVRHPSYNSIGKVLLLWWE